MPTDNQPKVINLIKVFSDAQELFEAYATHMSNLQAQLEVSCKYFTAISEDLREFVNEYQKQHSDGLPEHGSGDFEEKR